MSASKGQYFGGSYTALVDNEIRTIRLTSDGKVMVDATSGGAAAAALADNTSNPTVVSYGAYISGFDGTTWDRIRVGITAAGTPTGFVNVLPGVQYLTSPLTLTNGQVMPAQADVNGNLKNVEQYMPAYEDNTIGVAKVEHRYSSTYISTAATTTVKSGAGLLHAIVFGKRIANGVVTIYDNTAGSGTVLHVTTMGAALLSDPPLPVIFDLTFATGLTIVTSAAEFLTVVYR
jgi:hypothetical protein